MKIKLYAPPGEREYFTDEGAFISFRVSGRTSNGILVTEIFYDTSTVFRTTTIKRDTKDSYKFVNWRMPHPWLTESELLNEYARRNPESSLAKWMGKTSKLIRKYGQSGASLKKIDTHIRTTFPVKFETGFQQIIEGTGTYRRPTSIKTARGTEELEIEI